MSKSIWSFPKNIDKDQVTDGYKKKLAYMMSNFDMKRYLHNPTIIEYPDLANYQSFYDLMPTVRSYIIMLIEFQQSSGHWVGMFRYSDNEFYYFDSYGRSPTGEIGFILPKIREMLGEKKSDMLRLIENTRREGGKVIYNHFDFQSRNNGINTCGKWVVDFIKCCLLGFTMDEFQTKWIQTKKSNDNIPFDILLVSLF